MKDVQKFYNQHQYPNTRLFTKKQKKINRKILNKILKTANLDLNSIKNKKILVVGCGTGEKSILFAKYGAKVTAIDFSKGQLKIAKEKAKLEKIDIKFYTKDIIKDDLSYLPKFDIVFSVGVLHHSEDAYYAFCKISKLLKNNGIIIIGLYHRYSRLKYRISRFILRNLVSKDPDILIDWIVNKQKIFNKLKKAPISTLYDRYGVPYESYHTLGQVKRWFKVNSISFIGCSDNIKQPEILCLFQAKSIFFVSGQKIS